MLSWETKSFFNSLLKRLMYSLFYRLMAKVATVDIPLDSGDFCLMDQKVVEVLKMMPEHNRFIRGLRAWTGYKQIGVEYERPARAAGETKYSFSKLLNLAVDGIVGFSCVPLRVASHLGILISMFSFVGVMFTFLQRTFADFFAHFGLAPVPGYATIVISNLFLGGVQLICLGIIGEYIGRIYEEVRQRPQWIIREAAGITVGSNCSANKGHR